MTGVSSIKFPRARITVFFVFISVISVLAGALCRTLIPIEASVVHLTKVEIGTPAELSAFSELTADAILLLIIIYASAFTLFPTAISYAVMIYRGFTLGWVSALLVMSQCISAAMIFPVCYFAVNIIFADLCAATVFFSVGAKISSAASARELPLYSLKIFTRNFFVISAFAMLISMLPKIISALF